MKEVLSSGTNIARYQISSCISSQGLGEVYLARDTSTELEVALKVFPTQLVEEPRIRRRFVKIHSGVSAIRHRNVCEIYEGKIDEDNRPYVVMEFVKGQSLDLVESGGKITLREIVAFAFQIADALETSHAGGWLHLAIRPSNLILTEARQIKVLDLGQALAFPPALIRTALDPSQVTLGPSHYFSPEQVAGEKPDQRSDVFSLGTVCYELIAGQRPFAGTTFDEVSAAIREEQPRPLTEFREDIPQDLSRIIERALAKDLTERYQTIGEMARDLRSFVMFQARRSTAMTVGKRKELGAGKEKEESTGGLRERSEGLGAKIVGALSGRKTSWAKLIVAWLLLIGAFWGILLGGRSLSRIFYSEPPKPLQITRVSAGGKVTNAVISLSGERLAYAVNEGGNQSLIVRELGSGIETKVASDPAKEYRGLVFSPDGRSILYVKAEPENSFGKLYRIALSSGMEEDLGKGDRVGSVSVSPDGNRIAYLSASEDLSETIVTLDAPGSAGLILAKRKSPAFFSPGGFVWSPDGRVIVCVMKDGDSGPYLKIVALDVDSETEGESTIVSGLWSEVNRIAWLNDGSGLIVAAGEPAARVSQLWRVSYPSGDVTRITHDQFDYRGVSLTSDSNRLMSIRSEATSNIWVAPGVDAGQARQVTTESFDGVSGVDWTSDERLIYVSSAGGRETIWIADLNQNQQQKLTIAAQGGGDREYHPAVSPDDNYIAFIGESRIGSYLWRAEVEGRSLTRLTDENQVFSPSFSADGKSIVYSALRERQMVIAKSSTEGGAPVTLLETQAWQPAVSPAGQYIACNYWNPQNSKWKIAVFPIDGKPAALAFDAPGDHRRIVRWLPDGSGLSYIVTRGGVSNVWMQPLDEKPPVQLTNFKAGRIFDFAWSRDGGRIAFARGEVNSDPVSIQNFR
jgi:serine/threonine protein kinase/Tol biopolymer transport system component